MGTVKLQGISGHRHGTPTKELKIGDVIMWNFGYTSEVVGIHPTKSGKQITFDLRETDSGEVLPRRMGADRLVVVV